jgi:hypothetical protein
MELGKGIRLRIGRNLLGRKVVKAKRKVGYSNIGMVSKIGIVWDASDPGDFVHLSRFCHKMNERNINVRIIGYFPGKTLPDQYTAIRYFNCLKKDEVNFFYHPMSQDADDFINMRFDILIDLNFKKLLPLEYITSLSVAGLKVGLFDQQRKDNYDLMMEYVKPVAINEFLDQTLHYLEMIHEGQAEKLEKVY